MIRMFIWIALIALLLTSITAIFANTDPKRLAAAGWGMLSGALIVAGLWMIFAP